MIQREALFEYIFSLGVVFNNLSGWI